MSSIAGAFADAFESEALAASQLQWPSRRYEHDIAAYAWDTFGVRLHPGQVAIAEAVVSAACQRTAVVACHKSGKTLLAAIIALWWYCMPGGRVVLFAPRMETVEQGLYFSVRELVLRSGVCGDCKAASPDLQPKDYPQGRCPHSCPISEVPRSLAVDGLCSDDMREIRGYAASNPISLQGVSGRVLILADEASGIDDDAMEAV
ncbi:MAG: DEAD/DEAH box helicase family protein, partial [Labilithrix sp.]|nr:DEAD/DEAH box helicase family protein [Labilithrix sp.]